MTAQPPGPGPWLTPFFAAAGLAFGWAYFAVLRRGVAAFTAGGPLPRCVGWLLARLAAAVLFFAWAAHCGAWPLLASFLGFLGARQMALHAAWRAP